MQYRVHYYISFIDTLLQLVNILMIFKVLVIMWCFLSFLLVVFVNMSTFLALVILVPHKTLEMLPWQ